MADTVSGPSCSVIAPSPDFLGWHLAAATAEATAAAAAVATAAAAVAVATAAGAIVAADSGA